MKVSNQEINKKDVLRVYKEQCIFFGIHMKTDIEIEKLSARALYHACQHDYLGQPKSRRKAYIRMLEKREGFFTRFRKRFFPRRLK